MVVITNTAPCLFLVCGITSTLQYSTGFMVYSCQHSELHHHHITRETRSVHHVPFRPLQPRGYPQHKTSHEKPRLSGPSEYTGHLYEKWSATQPAKRKNVGWGVQRRPNHPHVPPCPFLSCAGPCTCMRACTWLRVCVCVCKHRQSSFGDARRRQGRDR